MELAEVLRTVSEPEALAGSVSYLADKLGQFLRRGEQVMICFPAETEDSLGSLFAAAVRRCDANPVVCGPDYRWKTLLRQAFFCKAGTIIAPPLVILGLTKLARAKATPLSIRNVVTAGYPCMDWTVDGIVNGLDCRTWSCLDWNAGPVVAGFSCRAGQGIHLREEEYGALIRDDRGSALPAGQTGDLFLFHRRVPDILLNTRDVASLETSRCGCGCASPRLMDMRHGPGMDPELFRLGEEINRWTSVLDCRLQKGPAGLEIEVVVFPGEKLPKFPSCAKLVVRPWDPEADVPFWSIARWKMPTISAESH